ncbi:MAG TPA: aspartyl/asparaginyl beta-hydroxylase domain-containing protein, partial [Caulobacteraceae bacterium]|nr:aspartyl/asparaginyl beta-hydroxylase domain-containing protein [Caulobacteraceae bacterium]
WQSDPLLIFDDTLFHRSVNNNDAIRYCLFLDVVRPSYFAPAFNAAIGTMSLMAGPFRSMFYRNWWFVRSRPTPRRAWSAQSIPGTG